MKSFYFTTLLMLLLFQNIFAQSLWKIETESQGIKQYFIYDSNKKMLIELGHKNGSIKGIEAVKNDGWKIAGDFNDSITVIEQIKGEIFCIFTFYPIKKGKSVGKFEFSMGANDQFWGDPMVGKWTIKIYSK